MAGEWASSAQGANVGDDASHGSRSGGEWACQEGACPRTLSSLEIPVAGADCVLTGIHAVAVHRDAHRTAWLAPLRARLAEHLVQSLVLRVALHLLRAGHHEHADTRRDVTAAHH